MIFEIRLSRFSLVPLAREERSWFTQPWSAGRAIDCFKCVSIDGDNKPCDDPFHNNGSLAFLESPCLGGRKGRDGLFPATSCIKIAGVYGKFAISRSENTTARLFSLFCPPFSRQLVNSIDLAVTDESGTSLMVRSCALDSGTLTTDSEIIRMSHCGGFYFDDK